MKYEIFSSGLTDLLGRCENAALRGWRMFEQAFKNIDDVLWKEAGCTTELDYTEQTSWMLFLKYLDDLEQKRELDAELAGKALRAYHRRGASLVGMGRAEESGWLLRSR